MKETLSFNQDWRFHLGDIPVEEAKLKSPMYIEAKTARKRCGPAAREYMDGMEFYNETNLISHETWLSVDVPHDYIIGQEPKEENNNTLGFFRYENAWYRKHFTLDAVDEGRRISLYFEGVGIHCKVYVNGCYMLTNNCGYNSFEVDVTDVVDFGQENVVALHVDVSEHEGWWYEGAGIYRPVWLIKSEPVAVDLYGVFVHPERKTAGRWDVPVDTTLRNDGYESTVAVVRSVARNAAGDEILALENSIEIPAREKATLHQRGEVTNPALWDIDSPNLYTLETVVTVGEKVVECQTNRFGFRTIRFDKDEGFFLNDRSVKIQGVCCHQDYGLTGKAVPKRIQRYRLELLKEMGANGYRCSHYPQHDYTMQCLDELGFLTMCETRWYESTPEGMAQLEMLIKRDRNHPCVILWSAGNEEPMHKTAAGRRIAHAMLYRARQLDGTRPVTTAVSHDPAHSTVADLIDVMGVNYNLTHFDLLHETYPDVPLVSTECVATSTTRGWYLADDVKRGYIYGYDRDTNKSFLAREKTWKYLMERQWIAGGYQWAGIEHRGETVWPRLCSQAGAIDLYLNRKDAFYQNQSHWTKKPMVHLLPHWNWPGWEGKTLRVSAYTNCDAVELFLNGASLGRHEVEPYGHAEWQVVYAPGKIEAVGYRQGQEVCRDVQETTGAPAALRLKLERDGVQGDGEDIAILTCDCVDEQGRHVPTAAPFVHFYTNEKGSILGTGSDVCDHVPVTCPDRQMRAGLISVAVRTGTEKGGLIVCAEADGLAPAVLETELL